MRGSPRSHASLSSPSISRVAAAISADCGEHRLQFGQLAGKLRQRLGPEKHFIRIANHARPSEIAHPIHNLHRTGTAVRQIAAVQNQVGRGLPQIRQDCLKRGSIAVYVGDDCDAHALPPLALVEQVRLFARDLTPQRLELEPASVRVAYLVARGDGVLVSDRNRLAGRLRQ